MAGEWIKVETALPEKPEVMRIARALNIEQNTVIGKLIRIWIWFDKNSVDGSVDGLVDGDVDDMVTHKGFAGAMREIGWLTNMSTGGGLTIPNFQRHNGESAKKRALKNERQARWRSRTGVGASSTKASTREEKRRVNPIVPETFVKFWNSYPRKDGKQDALKAFERIGFSNGDFEHMLSALEAVKVSEQWRRDGGKFIPQPAKWLRGRRFEDEGTTVPKAQWTP